jgi:hypothetical protein
MKDYWKKVPGMLEKVRVLEEDYGLRLLTDDGPPVTRTDAERKEVVM